MEFLSQIFAYIEKVWDSVVPWIVVREYEGVVILRLGKLNRILKPGPHWKWPVLDEVHTCETSTETISIKTQSLTTKDDKNIVVSAVVKLYVDKPEVYLLKVKDVSNAISDIAQGKIKDVITKYTWEECRDEKLDAEITRRIRVEAEKWGVKIDKATITDLALLRSIRLIR